MSLDYIKELGIDSSKATPVADAQENNQENFVQGSNTEEPKEVASKDTEPDISVELRKQIEGLEKRISDKDEYINMLREQSKQQEAEGQGNEVDTQAVDFWDDPEKIVNQLQEQIRIQHMQIAETQYANTVDDYWKTVNPQDLQNAVATDPDFQKEFNSSDKPYVVAYEYLSKKNTEKKSAEEKLREEMRAELMKELGVKDKPKETVPNMGSMGGSNQTNKSNAPDDGFAAVFGSKY